MYVLSHAFVHSSKCCLLRHNSYSWSICKCFPSQQMLHNRAEGFKDSPVFFLLLMCISPCVRMSHRINLKSVLADTYSLLKWYIFLSWQEHNYIGIFTILFQMRRSRWLQMLRNSLKKQGSWYVLAFHVKCKFLTKIMGSLIVTFNTHAVKILNNDILEN